MAVGYKTGGRTKGSLNKATIAAQAAAASAHDGLLTPLDYMLGVMRDTGADKDRRDRMAQAAAPYLHARIATVDNPVVNVNSSESEGIQISFVLPSRQANGHDDE